MMPPAIPVAQQPKAHSQKPLTSTAHVAIQAKTAAKAHKEEEDLEKILEYVEKEINKCL